MRARFILVCAVCWAAMGLWALDPGKTISQYSIRIWNMESGLPGNSVFALCQTGDGYLWIGTQDGLARFDGLRFEVYNKGNTPQLTCNVIRSLFEDREGNLWIGTATGGLTRYSHGGFFHYPIGGCPALSGISSIGQDRDGILWIGSFSNGLASLENGEFKHYTEKQGLPSHRVRSIGNSPGGQLMVATRKGIVRVDGPGRFTQIETPPRDTSITTALPARDGSSIWTGTVSHGLFNSNGSTITHYTTADGLPHPTVISLLADRQQNLWIGTDGGGLTRRAGKTFSTIQSGNGLACGFVYSLLEDREGSLWVGTLDGGLHQMRDSEFTTFTTGEGLHHDAVHCVFQDLNQDVWIGTRDGLNRFHNARLSEAPFFRGKAVMSICQADDRALWVGTWDGLFRCAAGDMSKPSRVTGLRDQRIRCITSAGKEIWIGTERGLCRYQEGKTSWFDAQNHLAGDSIQFIHRDRDGLLWIGSDGGINMIDGEEISTWKSGLKETTPLAYCMHEDNDGTLWLGTDSGLLRLKDGRATLFDDRSGLRDNHIYSILEDNNSCLWLAGRYGISRVRKQDFAALLAGQIDRLQPMTFNEKHGMRSRWCTGNATQTRDNRFWFPTSIGVSVIAPDRIKASPHPPAPLIEKIVANGELIPIPAALSDNSPLELDPGKKRLEFYYTAISFINPQEITFKIRLKGYDDDWVDMGTARNTTYTALPPGNYTFEIMAANAGGMSNPNAVTLPLRLKPFFYQTPWFIMLSVFVLLLLVMAVYRLRIRQLRVQKKKLTTLVEQRTRELRQSNDLIEAKNRQLEIQSEQLKELDEAKSRFFANISHEFRTPLTLLMGPLEQLITDYPDKQVKSKASLMLRNSRRLLGLVNQLLELARIDSGKTRLDPSVQDLVSFLRGIVDCFQPLAQQQNIRLNFQAGEETITIAFDQEKLEKVISNLLSNAFRHTPAGGDIGVSLEGKSDEMVSITVTDTGSGIAPDELPHIFDRFYRGQGPLAHGSAGSGIGLSLSKELVELHNGTIAVRSDCADGPGRGTEFIIQLPKADVEPPETVPQEDSPEQPPATGDARERPLILVVEDNADMRQYIKASLAEEFEVAEAEDGRRGIQETQKLLPDLVLSDITMPHTDGYQLCRALKNDILTSHIPVILLTARAEEAQIVEGLDAGADDYLTKPFNAAQLRQRCQNLILLRQQHQWEKKNTLSLRPEKLRESTLDNDFFDTLLNTVESHIEDSDFNVEALSTRLDMSPSTLYRKILGLTGQTPNRFIRSIRVKRAAHLLETGNGNISEIAAKVGIPDQSYFAKCFKEEFLCAPSAFKDSDRVLVENGERKIVLVVEDDTDTRRYIRESLEQDVDVREASDGEEGYSLATTCVPDLVISDVMMPKTDGFQLCGRLKTNVATSHIPVILLTARASEESHLLGLQHQADDYITKPFNPRILRARMKNLIRLRGHLQDKRKRRLHNLPHKLQETGIDRAFARELDTVIREHLSDPSFNISQLAAKLYISEATLYRKTMALTGQSPSVYLRSIRLKTAAEEIKKGGKSITDIAFAVGFSSQAYFTRCFKEQFQQLPSEYE